MIIGSLNNASKNPKSFPGLKLWLDISDDNNYTESGGLLTRLIDKSGNGNDSVPTGTQRGTVSIGASGKRILTTNGSTNYLPLTNVITSSTYTLFMVIKKTTSTSKVLASAVANATNYIQTGPNSDSINVVNSVDGTVAFDNSLTDSSIQQTVVFCVRRQSGVTVKQHYNGRRIINSSATDANLVKTNAQEFGQLLRSNNGFNFQGEFSSALLYTSYLSDADMLSVTRYLYNKHNISQSKIHCFGDSITLGTGATGSNGYANLLATALSKNLVKLGISGSIFQNSSGAARNGYDRFTTELLEYKYNNDLYVLYGTNDIALSTSTFQTQYDAFVATLIAKGYDPAHIWLGTPPRRSGDANSATVQALGTAVRTVGNNRGCHVAEIYTAFVNGGGDALLADAVHPNDAGHALIRDTFLAA